MSGATKRSLKIVLCQAQESYICSASDECPYQQAQENNWMGNYKIFIGSRANIEGDYSQLLASSIFCLMAPGV